MTTCAETDTQPGARQPHANETLSPAKGNK